MFGDNKFSSALREMENVRIYGEFLSPLANVFGGISKFVHFPYMYSIFELMWNIRMIIDGVPNLQVQQQDGKELSGQLSKLSMESPAGSRPSSGGGDQK